MNGRMGRDCSFAAIYTEVDPFFHPLHKKKRKKENKKEKQYGDRFFLYPRRAPMHPSFY